MSFLSSPKRQKSLFSYEKSRLECFPQIYDPESVETLRLSENPIKDFRGMVVFPKMTALYLDRTEIASFMDAIEQPSLADLSMLRSREAAGPLLSMYPLFRIMSSIVFGESLNKVNQQHLTKEEKKIASTLRPHLSAFLKQGWILTSVHPIRLYNPILKTRMIYFLKQTAHTESSSPAAPHSGGEKSLEQTNSPSEQPQKSLQPYRLSEPKPCEPKEDIFDISEEGLKPLLSYDAQIEAEVPKKLPIRRPEIPVLPTKTRIETPKKDTSKIEEKTVPSLEVPNQETPKIQEKPKFSVEIPKKEAPRIEEKPKLPEEMPKKETPKVDEKPTIEEPKIEINKQVAVKISAAEKPKQTDENEASEEIRKPIAEDQNSKEDQISAVKTEVAKNIPAPIASPKPEAQKENLTVEEKQITPLENKKEVKEESNNVVSNPPNVEENPKPSSETIIAEDKHEEAPKPTILTEAQKIEEEHIAPSEKEETVAAPKIEEKPKDIPQPSAAIDIPILEEKPKESPKPAFETPKPEEKHKEDMKLGNEAPKEDDDEEIGLGFLKDSLPTEGSGAAEDEDIAKLLESLPKGAEDNAAETNDPDIQKLLDSLEGSK